MSKPSPKQKELLVAYAPEMLKLLENIADACMMGTIEIDRVAIAAHTLVLKAKGEIK